MAIRSIYFKKKTMKCAGNIDIYKVNAGGGGGELSHSGRKFPSERPPVHVCEGMGRH